MIVNRSSYSEQSQLRKQIFTYCCRLNLGSQNIICVCCIIVELGGGQYILYETYSSIRKFWFPTMQMSKAPQIRDFWRINHSNKLSTVSGRGQKLAHIGKLLAITL